MRHLLIILTLLGVLQTIEAQQILPAESLAKAYTGYTDKGRAGLFNNQAALSYLDGWSAEVSAIRRYFSDGLNEFHVGVAFSPGRHTGAGIYVKRFGDDVYSEQSLGIAMGRRLTEFLSLGVALEGYQLNIAGYGETFQLNAQIGLMAEVTPSVMLSSHLYLPLEQVDQLSYANQTVFNLDVSVEADKHINLKGGIRKLLDQDIGFKFALDYRPVPRFSLHAGVLTNPSMLTFGAGLEIIEQFTIMPTGAYQTHLGWISGINLIYAQH